jgi:hypothetical protein
MNVWFVPTSVSHVGRFTPLMEALEKRGDAAGFFCVDAALAPADRSLDRVRSSGRPFHELPAGACNPDPHWSLVRMNRRRLARALSRAWRDMSIDCLVTGSEYGYVRRTIIRTAVEAGIPIVYLMDGLVVPPNPRARFRVLRRRKLSIQLLFGLLARLGMGDREGNSGADLILLMNRTGRDQLLRNGVPEESVKVVGSPVHERMAASDNRVLRPGERRELAVRLGLPEGRPIVLYAAQFLDHKRLIAQMMPAVRRSNAVLLVKFHPRMTDDLSAWRGWASAEGFRPHEILFYRDEVNSFDALRLCDVCVTVFSTVAVEAMILEKPVVYVQYLEVAYALPYASTYGAGIDAESPEELQSGIERILGDDALRREIVARGQAGARDDLAGLDGRSLERTLDEIAALVARRKGRTRAGGPAGPAR